ncbi:agamous-like MADS-box protein AGL92 [Lycium ferocissimum]|uniref:agamous-like MADS-box protein AGL92 n=1 Tax=Lycium ferocissimum TaxID=112874 RepID=UPI0028169A52|nr:agamous-like MADS-box protein AGL92 [Lycium ferocissimum]
MTRKKVKLALIESITERKASYKKRQKGFLKKAQEISTLCDVDVAIVIYSAYHNEPVVFPNHGVAIDTFTKLRQLSELEQLENMASLEEFTKQRIKKLEAQLLKVRKGNRVKEFTNKMHEMLNGKDIPSGMHPNDLNDLSYVINQNLKQVHEAIKAKAGGEGSTSNAPQPIAGPMVPDGTSSEEPTTPLLALPEAPIPVVPPKAPSVVPGGTNYEGPSAPMLPPAVAPLSVAPSMVPPVASVPTQVPQSMFQPLAPSHVVPLVGPLRLPPPPSLSFPSEMFPPMVPQFCPIPQQMALRKAPRMALSIASPMVPPTMASPMSSPMMAPPMFTPVTPPMGPSYNIPQMGASMTVNNYQNHTYGFSQSPGFTEMLNWDDDVVMALFDDPSFNNIDVQDPNHNNNF